MPLLAFQRTELLHGRLPLWNPHLLCGTPFLGNPQAFPLYPSSLLLFFLSAPCVVGVVGAVHVWLAACGTFFFLRQRGVGMAAGVLGAVSWAFGGFLVSKLQFPNMVQAASFLPWVLLVVDRVCDDPLPRRTALLGAVVGLSLLAAHPQMFLMQFYVCTVWAIWRVMRQKRTLPQNYLVRVIICLFAGLVLGVMLAMGQLLPTIELVRASVRTHLSLEQANRFILPPYAAFTNFVAPNFYGNPATDTPYIGRGNFWEPCAYGGVLPFCFAVVAAFFLFRSRPDVRFWGVVAVVSVWLAVGRDGGLFAVAFAVLPGVSKFHDAARWLYLATFALACLSAQGADALFRSFQRAATRRVFAALCITVSAADVVWFSHLLNPTVPAQWYANAEKVAVPPERVYFADENRAWGRWVSYQTYRTTEGEEARRFLRSQTPNSSVLLGGANAGGYEPVRRADAAALLDMVKQEVKQKTPSQTLGALGVRAIVTLDPATFAPVFHPVAGFQGRAYWRTYGKTNNAPLVIADPTPQTVVITLPPVPHAAGTVVLTDTLHPGWAAQVDNQPAAIYSTNGPFRAVNVGKNSKQMVFRYNPASARIGGFISLFAAGILTAYLFATKSFFPRVNREKWR